MRARLGARRSVNNDCKFSCAINVNGPGDGGARLDDKVRAMDGVKG